MCEVLFSIFPQLTQFQEGEQLIASKLHPQTIVQGWREASKIAVAALDSVAVEHNKEMVASHSDPAFREKLMNIARTTLSSKLLHQHKEHFANLAVNAVLRLKGSGNLDAIQVRLLLTSVFCDSCIFVFVTTEVSLVFTLLSEKSLINE